MTTTPHDTFREQLLDLAYGELGRREARALRAHVETCAECRAELARMDATRSAMSGLQNVPAPEQGEHLLLAAAREAARERARKPLLPSWVWGASIGAVAVAAVAVLTLKVAPSLRSPLAEPDPTELVGSAPPAPPEAPAASAPVQSSAPPYANAREEDGLVRDKREDEAFTAKPLPPTAAKRKASEPRDEDKVALGEKREETRRTASGGAAPETALKGPSSDDADRLAAAPPPAPAHAAAPPAPSYDLKGRAGDTEGPAPAAAPPPPAKPAAPAEPPRALAAAESEPGEAPADRVARAKQLAPQKEAGTRATLGRAREDAIARHARLAADGELRTATRAFPNCPGEASRVVESDAAGRIVKVTRHGTAAGKAFVAEQFYGEDGALAAVRWSADGRVHELRLGPGGPTGAVAAVPASALEPRSAADAGPDAPPRCGG